MGFLLKKGGFLAETIYAKDNLGRKIIANKADLEIIGKTSEEEVKGKTDLELFNKEIGQQGYNEDMAVIRRREIIINKEDSYIDHKGNKRWRFISKVPLRNENNEIIGLVGFSHDFTSLKRTEEQLRENKETLQLLFDSTAEGIYGIDTNGICTFCNKATLQLLGYSDEKEIIGKNMHDIAHYKHPDGSSFPEKDCMIFKAFQEGRGTHIDNEVFWKNDGQSFPVEYWSYPIKSNSNVIGSVVTFFDITERKYNEEVQQILYNIALESMTAKDVQDLLFTVKNQLNKVIDTTNFYVARYKPENQTLEKIVFVNEKYTIDHWSANNSLSGDVARTGRTKILNEKEVKELTFEHHKRPEYIPAKSWLGVPLIDQQEVIGVMVVQNYDSSNVFNKSHARLLEMVAHELVIVIQRTRMVENVIAAKEEAEKSDRLKSAFLANISHEIRTPMNGILGFLDLLNDKDINEKEKSQYLEIMNKSGQRLLETINDIIEISKLESGQVDVNISAVNTEEVMNDHYIFFKQQASNKNLELTLENHLKGNDALVKTDKFKLDAILTNILNNAIKYTQTGDVRFGNYLKGNNLIFYVKDTGIGIPPEKMETIFERFIQDDQYISRPQEGVGLGLSIVKGYIEMLDGKIWVDSEHGKGSTFFISIPYRK
ncbi:MAG: PAS domain S-box protein [Prolixibacteraceae bacterium]|nr:PAS domain S-box protein [Prolixibacteraceae bacterium]